MSSLLLAWVLVLTPQQSDQQFEQQRQELRQIQQQLQLQQEELERLTELLEEQQDLITPLCAPELRLVNSAGRVGPETRSFPAAQPLRDDGTFQEGLPGWGNPPDGKLLRPKRQPDLQRDDRERGDPEEFDPEYQPGSPAVEPERVRPMGQPTRESSAPREALFV